MRTTVPFAAFFRFLLPAVAVLFSTLAQGQDEGRFTVNGRLKMDGGDLVGARVVVYRNGAREKTITTNLNRFSLDLALNSNYVLSFEKDGFVAKKLQFDTRLPSGAVARNYAPFEFAVSLFKQYDDMNIVVFNQPVGMIRYETATDDFDYDTDYTKSIQSQLQKALAEVEQKQKEEAKLAEAVAKQQAADAKAQAKEEAEAKKLGEAKAKEEQALLAEASRAEQARKDAEAKAEQERTAAVEREQQQRKAAEAKAAATPPAPLPKAVPAAPKPAPAPAVMVKREAPAPKVVANMSLATPREDQDQRRRNAATLVEEPSRMAKARPVTGADSPQYPERIVEVPMRRQELIVEPNKVMTVIHLEQGPITTEYRKVIHKWGDTFYFKNGETCSRQIYEREALGEREQPDERLVDMAPRGR